MRGICLTCPFIAILTVKVMKSVKSFLSQFGLAGKRKLKSVKQFYRGSATGIYFMEQLTQKLLTLCHPADEAGACETADNTLMCRRLPSLLCSLKGSRTITEIILQKINKQNFLHNSELKDTSMSESLRVKQEQ